MRGESGGFSRVSHEKMKKKLLREKDIPKWAKQELFHGLTFSKMDLMAETGIGVKI